LVCLAKCDGAGYAALFSARADQHIGEDAAAPVQATIIAVDSRCFRFRISVIRLRLSNGRYRGTRERGLAIIDWSRSAQGVMPSWKRKNV